MSSKTVSIVITTVCLLISTQFCEGLASRKTQSTEEVIALRIYMPREITIKNDTIRLGQVSIIRGEESLIVKAGRIALGQISVPGQKIIIDRPTVLSRLACNGIALSNVKLTGAEKIKVKRLEQIITGAKFVELASSFLKKHPPNRSLCQLNAIWIPKDLVISDLSKDIRLSRSLVKGGAKSRAKVQIIVLADGKEIGTREVTFRLKYNCHRAVTLVDIPEGGSIGPENIKIQKDLSDYPEPANWSPPYGLIAERRIPANTTIRPYMLCPADSSAIIKRNQTVVIRIKRPGFLITATGKALQNGQGGEYIKVQNADSQRIIFAKINQDGTVEPLF